MFYVRKIGKEFSVSEIKSENDVHEFESYIDAYIFAKEMNGNISLEAYKETRSDAYRFSHLEDSCQTKLEMELNSYAMKKHKENKK